MDEEPQNLILEMDPTRTKYWLIFTVEQNFLNVQK